jgi:hypothetical protein
MRRRDLLDLGHHDGTIRRARVSGQIVIPRRGWVASPLAPRPAIRALELGGILGAGSALAVHGIWVDDDHELVVACRPTSSRLVSPSPGERRIWVPQRFPDRSFSRWRASVLDALLQLATVAPRDALIASVDSALEKRLLTRRELALLLAALPHRLRSVAREIDGAAMSGNETHMRLALTRAGYHVQSQVAIPGIGTVDLLVDGWLIIELDSKGWHDGESHQTRDRTRDGNGVLLGYGHERFVWSQVRYSMPWCLDVVEARLREGRPDRKTPVAAR